MSSSVSVVIPVFNGAPFIRNAVASVRNQTRLNIEILVVDDGSTDGTQAILADLEKTAEIKWFQQDHSGPATSRNRGVKVSQGEIVALLDCDDIWMPDKLEAQLSILEAKPEVGVVHSDFEVVDEDGIVLERVKARQSSEPLVQAFQGGHVALPSTLVVRRTVLEKVGGLDPELYGSEDSDLTIRLHAVTGYECVDRVLVRKLERGHGFRDMAFDESVHKHKVLNSRERFLQRLERMQPLTVQQRSALDREWGNYFLQRGQVAEQSQEKAAALRFYVQAIQKAPARLRPYTRLFRAVFS